MSCPFLSANQPILLIGAGPVTKSTILQAAAGCADVVCVDGGLAPAINAGLVPEVVVGDFDSIDPDMAPDVCRFALPDQNKTDFQKALGGLNVPLVVAAGFLGGRLDHQLAAFSAMITADMPVIAVDEDVCVFSVPAGRTIEIKLKAGDPVALYPLLPVLTTATGLVWSFEEYVLAPDATISTSNQMDGDTLTVFVDEPGLLCIVPAYALPAVKSALLTSGR